MAAVAQIALDMRLKTLDELTTLFAERKLLESTMILVVGLLLVVLAALEVLWTGLKTPTEVVSAKTAAAAAVAGVGGILSKFGKQFRINSTRSKRA